MEICRLCNITKPQRDLTNIDDSTREIPKKLRETFNVELIISQNKSYNFCCRTCVKKLDTSYEFYHQIVENQKKFEAFNFDPLVTIVKSEVEEIIDEDYGDYDETYDDGDDGDEDYCAEDDGGTTSNLTKAEPSTPENQELLKISKAVKSSYKYPKKRKYDCIDGQSTDFIKSIHFTANEIDDCTIVEDGQIKFLQKRHFNTQGKTPYLRYLCDKLRDASSTKSIFKVSEGFKASGKKNKVCYVFCDHRRKMPVSFVAFDHQFGSPLTMKWKVDCALCAGLNTTEKKETKENLEPRRVISYEPAATDNLEFKKAMKILAGSLNTVLLGIEHKCLSNLNPMEVLFNNIAEFGIIANSAIVDTIFALQKTRA
ncbi:uncharacterized protein [Chironomus tepperi]|uniref:uncharacterized protein n=1 Tax=Chironomus tepperi TaxID=113505 RepID=UPI00391F3854